MSGTESQRREKLGEIYERADVVHKKLAELEFTYLDALCFSIITLTGWINAVIPLLKPDMVKIVSFFISVELMCEEDNKKDKDGLLSKPD